MASPNLPAKLNLQSICDALGGIEHKWFKIGIWLGIQRNKLLEFRKDEDPLSAVIDYWLRGNVTESGNPISWNSIVAMLKSKYVGEPALAEEINKECCQHEDYTVAAPPISDLSEQAASKENSKQENSQATGRAEGKINSDMKRDLEVILEKNLIEIISKYASYVDCLRIAIKEKEVSPEDLRSYLLSLCATKKGQKLALLSDKKSQLEKCHTISEIFNLLNAEWTSFLNYDIFQLVLQRYEICDDQEGFKYPEHLKTYIRNHQISEFAKVNPHLKSKNDSKELILKCDIKTTCSLAKIVDLKKQIAGIMNISSAALEIIDIEEGCVIVTFSIPTSVADALFTADTEITLQQEAELQAIEVLWLACNGHTFHFEKKKHNEALQKLKEQLTCSICFGTYTNPKQLQCNHSYCQQCLKRLVLQDQQGQSILTCPVCRQITPVPATGIEGLETDTHANQLLEIAGKDWKELILTSSELASEVIAIHESSLPLGPDYDSLIDVFCWTCGEAICWRYSHGKHFGHDCEALKEAFLRCKEDILSLLNAIEQSLVKLNTQCSEISNQRAAIEEAIKGTITMEDRRTELISQLHLLSQTKHKSLAEQRDQLETVQVQLDKYHIHLEGDYSNQKEALLKKSSIVKQVKKLTTSFQLELLEPNTKADMIYLSPAVYAMENGKVCTLDLSRYCTASTGTGIAIVGKTSSSLLQIWCPVKISCQLVSETTGTIVEGSVKKRGQNQYKINYRPTVKGSHKLHIKVEGQHIKGSPFPVTARSSVKALGSPILTICGVRGPQGVALHSRGEVVVTEMSANCVTVFSPNGKKLRSFGSGQGQFQIPFGVALDGEENVFVTDESHCIQKFTFQGEFLTSVGNENTKPLEFNHPFGIAFNASNSRVYVVDSGCHIQVLNSDLKHLYTFGGKGSGKGAFIRPRHVACDSTGNIYVADWGNHRIQVFTADGDFLRMFGRHGKHGKTDSKPEYYGIAIDFSDRVYISDYKNHNISVYTCRGRFLTSFGSEGIKQGHFRWPSGLAVDNSGIVYVCGLGNNRIQVF